MSQPLATRLFTRGFAALNRLVPWHRLPARLGVLNLLAFRLELRAENLHDTNTPGSARRTDPATIAPDLRRTRSSDGSYTDVEYPAMGRTGARFGRNVPLRYAVPEPEPAIWEPNPREVSRKLLTRERFIPATTLNLLAAAWIQFMTHDWFFHDRERKNAGRDIVLPLQPDDPWPERPMRIPRTPADPTRCDEDRDLPPTFTNRVSHWWDASAIYGSDAETQHRCRSHELGKLRCENGRLPLDPDTGKAITGFTENWWLGLGLLHTLFVLEHNAICDRLHAAYPDWSDERLFETARLANAALMAKIHTVEWTPGILGHPALQIGMRAAWWGLAGERLHRRLGHIGRGDLLSGIPGSRTDHHGAPYALTEEFVSVYRLHPLIPDEVRLSALATGKPIKELPFKETFGRRAATVIGDDVSVLDCLYSFGTSHPGAITLHNFPRFLQDLTLEDHDDLHLDLGAVDIARDRERGVPRYTRFRQLLHLPPVRSFAELTPDPRARSELKEVYGDVDRVDLLVGMQAEQPPRGFGFSDTAFRVFILMASRRLKSDRFLSADFRPEIYSPEGIAWVQANDMKSVLLRHYPELEPALRGVANAFAPWNRRG